MLLAGLLAGLTILTRANALVLLLPLGPRGLDRQAALLAPGARRPGRAGRARTADRLAVDDPQRDRLRPLIPVSTQLGSALAGTYNEQARADKENPASWRSIGHVPSYRELYSRLRFIPEPEVEDILSERSKDFIREHPEYVGKVALWTTLRTFELGGLDWSRHTAGTISVGPGWANAGVFCFWVFALLAIAEAFTKAARRTPLWVWLIPLLLYLSVVFLARDAAAPGTASTRSS